ncbi:MAG: phytanoyl-CoA dioxygenase family protein [Thermomicrobiales bacterium]
MIRKLTPDEQHLYDEQGFVLIIEVFSAAELEGIDQEIDRILPEADAKGERSGWIYKVAEKSDLAGRFAEDERLLGLIEKIVHPGIAIHSSKIVTKLPRSDDVCHWHQDEAFYLDADDPDTVSKTRMSVWVPLQDANRLNGCLWIVPGSHRWGLESYTTATSGTCTKRIDREAYANEHAIAVPVKAGSAVLFSAWTWHHSKNNQTDTIRRAFIVSYQEATVSRGAGDQLRVLRPASPALAEVP